MQEKVPTPPKVTCIGCREVEGGKTGKRPNQTTHNTALTFENVVVALLDLDADLHVAHSVSIEHVVLGAAVGSFWLVAPLVGVQAVLFEFVERVVLDLVVTTAEAEPDAVLAVLNLVVVNFGAERLQEGDAGVGVVVDVVVCTQGHTSHHITGQCLREGGVGMFFFYGSVGRACSHSLIVVVSRPRNPYQ